MDTVVDNVDMDDIMNQTSEVNQRPEMNSNLDSDNSGASVDNADDKREMIMNLDIRSVLLAQDVK